MAYGVVYTSLNRELTAVRELERQGVGVVLPVRRIGRWRGDQLKFETRPLLARYAFVALPENGAWGEIADTEGVARVLTSDSATPARVPDADVARLTIACAAGDHDVVPPRRDAAGRFRKHRRRRRRPRHGRVHTGTD